MRPIPLTCWAVLATAVLGGCQPHADEAVRAAASAPAPAATQPTATPPTTKVAAGEIAARDQLRLSVVFKGDDADPTVSVDRVDDQGRVAPNMLGPIRVAGLSEPAAAAAIVKAYQDAGITATVTVSIVAPSRSTP